VREVRRRRRRRWRWWWCSMAMYGDGSERKEEFGS